jgi:hypothetical protein
MADPLSAWSHPLRFAEIPPGGLFLRLAADEGQRAQIARALDLLELTLLEAQVSVRPWQDGAEIAAAWRARFGQACGVTLERLDQALEDEFIVRVVPPGSAFAPSEESLVDIDPEAEDPPDVADAVDLAAYVIEHFALEIDPFPRKEGAEFVAPEAGEEMSPFAVLRQLRKDDPS